MHAIVLPDYNGNIVRAMRSLELKETEIPAPLGNQVLIRVTAAPCNPSDIAFMRGGYGITKPVPVVMGFECTGTVIATGPETGARALQGRRVSCFARESDSGTWATHFLTDAGNCIRLMDGLPNEQAAALCINPFTAFALVQMAVNAGAKAIIQNAASGQIGVFVRALAAMEGIRVINLVRKEEHVQPMLSEGETDVLCLTDPELEEKLRRLAAEHRATIAFDAIGGDLSGLILNTMPPGSQIVIYGGLSGKPVGQFNPLGIIFAGKNIRGFNLGEWKNSLSGDAFSRISDQIQELIIQGIMNTRIQGIFKLEEVQAALEQYIRNMSSGKILFCP
jgi:NADPH:quinone reductase-like Zn-dependent oxidoreductase